MNEKHLVAIFSGLDWNDASVEHLLIPVGMNLHAEKQARDKYYNEEYLPALRTGKQPEYKTFTQWLIERGACEPAETDIEEFWEY